MQRSNNYWKSLVFIFFLGWMLMYANRTVLTPLMSVLESTWHLSKTQLGLLSSLFFLMYSAVQVPAGLLADRIGRKQILVPGFLLHAAGALLSGVAQTYPFLLGARMLTGISQGTYFSSQYAISTSEVPPRYRTVSSAITMSGSALGIGLGTLVASLLVFRLGFSWRVPFIFFGTLALVLAAVMARVIRPEARLAKQHDQPDQNTPFHPSKDLIKLFLVGALTMYGFYVIVTWLPYYLQMSRGMEGGIAGAVSTLMPLATVPAAIFIGLYADRTGKRHSLMVMLVPVAAVALMLVVISPSRIGLYLALLLYGFTGKLVIDPLLIAMVSEQTDASSYAKAFAFLNFAGTISMVLAPTITGLIVDMTGSFHSGFLLAAGLQAIAWLVLLTMRRQPSQNRAQA